jgi:type IV pilus assembly protein PilO
MGDLLDRIASAKPLVKMGILLGAIALLCAGYWYFFYNDILDEADHIDQAIGQVRTEKDSYEARKREYQAFRLEVNRLLEEQKELLRELPKKDDIEQFIENVNSQVEIAGLSKVSSVREAAVPEEMYVRIPIRMSLAGTYHQINRFFKALTIADAGEKKRIVTIADLQLQPTVAVGTTGGLPEGNGLKADFVAQTFQFVDKPNAAKPATGGGR